jgi:hypothetical protein
MQRTTFGRARLVALATAVVSLAALGGGCSAGAGAAVVEPEPAALPTCTPDERAQALAAEQARVLELLEDVRVLADESDFEVLKRPRGLAASYTIPSHALTSILGMGFSVANAGRVVPGEPHLLFYRPSPDAIDVGDPWGPDFPYELVGWGYGAVYTPGQVPIFPDDPGLRCLELGDWFLHEAGVHPYDTGRYVMVAPEEEYAGQVAAPPPSLQACGCEGAPHPRLWDIHFWIDGGDVPVVSMLNPGEPIPGWDPEGAFFYPDPRALDGVVGIEDALAGRGPAPTHH